MQADHISKPVPPRAERGRRVVVALAGFALLLGACSAPPYPPEGRSFPSAPQGSAQGAAQGSSTAAPASYSRGSSGGIAPRSGSGESVPTLSSREDRWWPEWSDPANWFLEEPYRL